jgi:hypothetical protein
VGDWLYKFPLFTLSSRLGEESAMSRFKTITLIALIPLAFGVALIGDAMAEKYKGRIVGSSVKWSQVEVGDEEGHVIAVGESRGVFSNLEGRTLPDSMFWRLSCTFDLNLKTGLGSYVFKYTELTDRDQDKIYTKVDGNMLGQGRFAGNFTYIKGTGKWKGIKGGGTYSGSMVSPTEFYVDQVGEVELPR